MGELKLGKRFRFRKTQTLDRLGERLDQLEGVRGESVSYGDTKHHQSHHVAH